MTNKSRFLACLFAVAACLSTIGICAQDTQYFPGQFLTVEHESITAGSKQQIIFDGPGGYSVTIPTTNTSAGKAIVAVPPYVDVANRDFPAAQLPVTLDGIDCCQDINLIQGRRSG